jgi:hypothetical protein
VMGQLALALALGFIGWVVIVVVFLEVVHP